MIDEKKLAAIWDKGIPVDGLPAEIVRKDACGALMVRQRFEDQDSEFGWEIDHIYPLIKGGDESIENLRPMQWKNRREKSNDFPVYFGTVTAEGNHNIPLTAQYRISPELASSLSEKYESGR